MYLSPQSECLLHDLKQGGIDSNKRPKGLITVSVPATLLLNTVFLGVYTEVVV